MHTWPSRTGSAITGVDVRVTADVAETATLVALQRIVDPEERLWTGVAGNDVIPLNTLLLSGVARLLVSTARVHSPVVASVPLVQTTFK